MRSSDPYRCRNSFRWQC